MSAREFSAEWFLEDRPWLTTWLLSDFPTVTWVHPDRQALAEAAVAAGMRGIVMVDEYGAIRQGEALVKAMRSAGLSPNTPVAVWPIDTAVDPIDAMEMDADDEVDASGGK